MDKQKLNYQIITPFGLLYSHRVVSQSCQTLQELQNDPHFIYTAKNGLAEFKYKLRQLVIQPIIMMNG